MEIQLQELIDQIKKDGVEAAENEAASILAAAKVEAQKIVEEANSEADKIMANAKLENERLVKSSEDAIRQAGRNLLISFRESISKELNVILSEKVSNVYSSEAFSNLIINVIENLSSDKDSQNIEVILNAETLRALEEAILAGLKEKMLNGVTLRANDNFDGGFRIAKKDGDAYYDYSTEAVVDMLSNYLSPKVTKLLKEAE